MRHVLFALFALGCAAPRPLKVGVVNMKTIMDKSVWGRKHQRVISAALAKREKHWTTTCGDPLKALAQKRKQAELKKSPELQLLQEKDKKLRRRCYALKVQYQNEVKVINENYSVKILDKVKETATIIGRTLQLDLVVTRFRGIVLYASERVDITDRVVVALEESP